jgi:aminoglycoside 2''-phosphotransferase
MTTPQVDISSFLDQIIHYFPELADLRQQSLVINQQGWGSLVLDTGEFIFRFARLKRIQESYALEARLLPGLAAVLPLAIPQFTHIAPDFSFVGYRKIAGEQIDETFCDHPQAIAQLAGFLNSLHSIPIDQVSTPGMEVQSKQGWRQYYVDFYTWARAEALPRMEPALRPKAIQKWQDFLDDERCFDFQPVLIHRDLSTEHIIWLPETGEISGVIDWEDAAIGDPVFDFVGLWQELVEAVMPLYHRPLGSSFKKRIQFYQSVIPYHFIRYGLATGQPSFLEDGLRNLSQSLI